ncbi:TauD/TfdA dioxygenase family protein [Kitasatospora sp. NPDC001175]|uniref:TauD/TfdA dioxygenase family protein n=1 Tax=Kitasatospora sp. NPDC001175 TaxID=3157103 RepID=UPI003D007DA2
MILEVRKVAGNIGAEIAGLDLAADLDGGTVAEIRDAVLAHKVVFFRGQRLTPESQQAFARRFGSLTTAHPVMPAAEGYTRVLDIDTSKVSVAADFWHTDLTHLHRPPLAAVLRAVTVPPWGGDTLWANTAHAYTCLPAGIRAMVDVLWAVHTNTFDYATSMRAQEDSRLGELQRKAQGAVFETLHPVVRVHPETGERALLLSHNARFSPGMSAPDFEALRRLLQSHITTPENTVRWRWAPGDVAFWDNRATQHYAALDYGDQPRHMQRVTLVGDVPVSVDGRRSEALTGDDSAYNGGRAASPAS